MLVEKPYQSNQSRKAATPDARCRRFAALHVFGITRLPTFRRFAAFLIIRYTPNAASARSAASCSACFLLKPIPVATLSLSTTTWAVNSITPPGRASP